MLWLLVQVEAGQDTDRLGGTKHVIYILLNHVEIRQCVICSDGDKQPFN